jgi:hypothetical protein
MSDALPNHVQQFLRANIQSIAQLELLLLLYSNRNIAWSVGDAAKNQYTAVNMTQAALESLRSSGLVGVVEDGETRYQYAPTSENLDQLIGELAQLYSERRVSIVNAIYSSPLDSLQSFADAFRIRKKENE